MEDRPRYGVEGYKPPTAEDFRALLKRWNLTGSAAGALVGVNGRHIRRYTGGHTRVPYAVLFTLSMTSRRGDDLSQSVAARAAR